MYMGGASSKFVARLQWRSQDFGSGDLQQKIFYKNFRKFKKLKNFEKIKKI